MSSISTYDALLDACRQEGCPLCRLEHEADLRYLDRLFYELVNDYNIRVQLRASLGFCYEHGEMALDEVQGKALGVAIIYDDLLRVALEQLATPQALLKVNKKCPACENRLETTRRALAELSKSLGQEILQGALKNSQGLCLGHLRQALEHLRAPEKRKVLLDLQQKIMQTLRAELAEYIRKNDYRFAGEAFGSERDAWRRAVRLARKS